MTVTSQQSKTIAIGNGVQTAFTYSFFVPGSNASDQSNLQVTVTTTAGVQSVLATSQYSIANSLSKSAPGGVLTYSPVAGPLPLNYTITIARVLPFTQTTTIANQGGFYPNAVDAALDTLEMQIQQVEEQSARAIIAPIVDSPSINLTLPAAAQRASQALGFDSSGNVTTFATLPAGTVSSAMAPVVDAASIAAAQALLGVNTPGFGLPYGQIYAGSATYGFSASGAAAANTTALNAAIAAAVAQGGGTIVLPAGTFALNALTAITGANNIVIQGQGRYSGGTTLNFANATGDCIVFNGGAYCGIRGCWISASVVRTSGYAIKHYNNYFENFIDDIRIDYHYNGIFCGDGAGFKSNRITLRYMFGIYGIYMLGTTGIAGVTLASILCDNPYSSGTPTASSVVSWATSTGFTSGQVAVINGNIYQCATSGTSASGGSGPSGVPAVAPASVFTTGITDGTAVWRFVCSASLAWIVQDSYAYSITGVNIVLLDGAYGYLQYDTAAVAANASVPKWAYFFDLECDHNYYNGANLQYGQGFSCTGSWIGSTISNNGVYVQATYQGEASVDTTRIVGCAQNGVLIQAGPKDVDIHGCVIAVNSQVSSTTYHGVTAAANATDFSVTDNTLGFAIDGSGSQGYGCFVATGTSDRYVISQNRCHGNATGTVSDSGSGSAKSVTANIA